MQSIVVKCITVAEGASHDMKLGVPPNIFHEVRMMAPMASDDTIMESFINHTYHLWDKIKTSPTAELSTIVQNLSSLFKFEQYYPSHTKSFEALFSSQMPVKYQEQLRANISEMVKLCLLMIHKRRVPVLNKGKPAYRVNAMPSVNLKYHSQVWDVPLLFTEIA